MENNQFSLTRVRLTNYKSIATADVSLGNLLLLVGPNGSGKSNFLDALRLTSESLQASLDLALRDRGGAAEVRRGFPSEEDHFAVHLEFTGDLGPDLPFTGRYGFEIMATPDGGFRVSDEYCAVDADYSPDGQFRVTEGRLEDASERVMPPVSDQRLYLVAAAGLNAFRPVFDGLAGMRVFNLSPDAMRRPQPPVTGEYLDRDGGNIASVLGRLDRDEPEKGAKARVEEYLHQIVPGMQRVRRVDLGRWETLQFIQDMTGTKTLNTFYASSVSDGTLRALGVLVALFAGTGSTLSPVGIEEPESALHPAATGVLLDALRDASGHRQVIVTSHSPDLLDRHDFDLSELRAVRLINGETVIGELDQAGALALREDLYTPGELLRTDQLLPARPENTETR